MHSWACGWLSVTQNDSFMCFWGTTGWLIGNSETFYIQRAQYFSIWKCHLSYQLMIGNGCSTNRHLWWMLQCEKLDGITSWGLPHRFNQSNHTFRLSWSPEWSIYFLLLIVIPLFLEEHILSPQLISFVRAEAVYFSLVFHSTGCKAEHIVGLSKH